jgi:hypothetical protein
MNKGMIPLIWSHENNLELNIVVCMGRFKVTYSTHSNAQISIHITNPINSCYKMTGSSA